MGGNEKGNTSLFYSFFLIWFFILEKSLVPYILLMLKCKSSILIHNRPKMEKHPWSTMLLQKRRDIPWRTRWGRKVESMYRIRIIPEWFKDRASKLRFFKSLASNQNGRGFVHCAMSCYCQLPRYKVAISTRSRMLHKELLKFPNK